MSEPKYYPKYSLKEIEEHLGHIAVRDIVDTIYFYGNYMPYIDSNRFLNVVANTYFEEQELELIVKSMKKGFNRIKDKIELYRHIGSSTIPNQEVIGYESFKLALNFAEQIYKKYSAE